MRSASYEFIRELGRGGMGVVHLARQVSLDRLVVVKTLLREVSRDPVGLRRLEREAAVLMDRSHPCVVRLVDVDITATPPFLVFEYLEGRPLSRLLEEGVPGPDAALRIMRSTLEGLEFLHENHVLHRDLKPANIMVDDVSGAKIIDFGLALETDSDETRLTRAGARLGTLSYMAPEQLEGGELDERSDLYSFGLVAYELAVGRPVFAASATAPVLPVERCRRPPEFPRDMTSRLQPGVLAAIEACLAIDPGRRPRSARRLLERLEAAVAPGRRRTAHRPETVPGGSGRRLVVLTAIGALMAAGPLLMGLFRTHRAPLPIPPEVPTPGPVTTGYRRPAYLEALSRSLEASGERLLSGQTPQPASLLQELLPVLNLAPDPEDRLSCSDYWEIVRLVLLAEQSRLRLDRERHIRRLQAPPPEIRRRLGRLREAVEAGRERYRHVPEYWRVHAYLKLIEVKLDGVSQFTGVVEPLLRVFELTRDRPGSHHREDVVLGVAETMHMMGMYAELTGVTSRNVKDLASCWRILGACLLRMLLDLPADLEGAGALAAGRPIAELRLVRQLHVMTRTGVLETWWPQVRPEPLLRSGGWSTWYWTQPEWGAWDPGQTRADEPTDRWPRAVPSDVSREPAVLRLAGELEGVLTRSGAPSPLATSGTREESLLRASVLASRLLTLPGASTGGFPWGALADDSSPVRILGELVEALVPTGSPGDRSRIEPWLAAIQSAFQGMAAADRLGAPGLWFRSVLHRARGDLEAEMATLLAALIGAGTEPGPRTRPTPDYRWLIRQAAPMFEGQARSMDRSIREHGESARGTQAHRNARAYRERRMLFTRLSRFFRRHSDFLEGDGGTSQSGPGSPR